MADIVNMATGKRKEAVARVRLRSGGSGKIIINNRAIEEYFGRQALRMVVNQPLVTAGVEGRFDVAVNVVGGGISGQAGAIKHGLAKALCEYDPNLRPALKKEGFLTRDARVVERKKYGRHKARKRPQFSKR